MYESNPSGTYGGWKATAIGSNFHGAQNLLKQDYKEGLTLEEAIQLLMKVIHLIYCFCFTYEHHDVSGFVAEAVPLHKACLLLNKPTAFPLIYYF